MILVFREHFTIEQFWLLHLINKKFSNHFSTSLKHNKITDYIII